MRTRIAKKSDNEYGSSCGAPPARSKSDLVSDSIHPFLEGGITSQPSIEVQLSSKSKTPLLICVHAERTNLHDAKLALKDSLADTLGPTVPTTRQKEENEEITVFAGT
jgi:hypothetical protein